MNRIVVGLALALVSILSSLDLRTTRLAAAQRAPRPVPEVRPGAPEPIVGGTRPPVIGSSAGVSAGHPLTSAAGMEILLRGGNAFDAGVAAILTGGVVEQDLFGLGGESLVLVYPVKEKKVTSIVGQGWEPRGASIEYFKSRGKTDLGADGLDPTVVPGALHGALTVLEKWGTMSFEQVPPEPSTMRKTASRFARGRWRRLRAISSSSSPGPTTSATG